MKCKIKFYEVMSGESLFEQVSNFRPFIGDKIEKNGVKYQVDSVTWHLKSSMDEHLELFEVECTEQWGR